MDIVYFLLTVLGIMVFIWVLSGLLNNWLWTGSMFGDSEKAAKDVVEGVVDLITENKNEEE